MKRDIEIAERTGCRLHVCHISTKESVELIRAAKARGVKVTCETAPHYLALCDEDMRLHVDLHCARGIIEPEETVLCRAGETKKDIAVITRVGKPVACKILGIEYRLDIL